MRLLMRAAGAVGLSLVLAATASAQGLHVGVKAGWDHPTFSGNDVSGVEARNDFAGGLFLTIPAGPVLAFQPELLYLPKGTQMTEQVGVLTATAKFKLDYAEVPLLLRLNVPAKGAPVRPVLFGGPFIGFKTSCKIDVSGTGISGSYDCNDASVQAGIKSTDVGATFGGGLEFPLGGASALVEARYDLGLQSIDNPTSAAGVAPADVKTRALMVFVGVSFPLGGGKSATQRTR